MNPIQRQQAAQSSVHPPVKHSHCLFRVPVLISSCRNKNKNSNVSTENFLRKRTS
jgi:hypothetical protein